MITEIKLENFKGHQSTQLSLDDSRLHALVGKNSSGKTSILQAIYYLSMLTDKSFARIFQDDRSPEFLTKTGQQNMSVLSCGYWGNINPKFWKASFSWEQNDGYSWKPKTFWNINNNSDGSNRGDWNVSLDIAPDSIIKSLKYSVYLKLVAGNLAKAAYSDRDTPRVEFDGSGLAPAIDYFRDDAPDRFQLLQETLKRIIPEVYKVGVTRAKTIINHQRLIEIDGKSISYEDNQEIMGKEVVLDTNTGNRIPAHALSEGTLLTLGFLTVLLHPKQPNLILLDDIEQGLHPRAQRELIAVFKEIVQTNPNLQIIFTTHSPYIVDELDFSQVHVLDTNPSGFTSCKRLDEHPDVEWAKQTLTTGEFWNAEGEEWINEGVVNV